MFSKSFSDAATRMMKEAEERERILNTDIDEMSDSVLNKYNKEN